MSSRPIVAELRYVLMPAAPEGPSENILLARCRRQQDAFDEVTDLGNRQRNEVARFLGVRG